MATGSRGEYYATHKGTNLGFQMAFEWLSDGFRVFSTISASLLLYETLAGKCLHSGMHPSLHLLLVRRVHHLARRFLVGELWEQYKVWMQGARTCSASRWKCLLTVVEDLNPPVYNASESSTEGIALSLGNELMTPGHRSPA